MCVCVCVCVRVCACVSARTLLVYVGPRVNRPRQNALTTVFMFF